MPVTYHNRFDDDIDDDNDNNEASSSVLTDTDDAIVLSDLVRTGEASRLRRRGAMRLDHHHHHAQRSSPTVVVVAEPTWESDSDEQQQFPSSSQLQQRRSTRRTRPLRRHAFDDELDFSYTLFCGGEEDDDEGYNGEVGDSTPFVPSPLPVHTFPTPPPAKRHTSHLNTASKGHRKLTNGCGALIHLYAAPRPRSALISTSSSSTSTSTWVAHTPASTAVVPIDDPIYLSNHPGLLFPKSFKPHQQRASSSSCQCVREAVACALCGNILGRRFRGCRSSNNNTNNFILGPRYQHRQKEDESQGPEGMRYWREGGIQQYGQRSDGFVYTFLASAVSSSPSYVFPTCNLLTASSTTSTSTVALPASRPTLTTSPSSSHHLPNSYSDRDRDLERDHGREPELDRGQNQNQNEDQTRSVDPDLIDLTSSDTVMQQQQFSRPSTHPLTILDRLITASPTPLSDEEREAYRARAPPAVRARYSFGYHGASYGYGYGPYGDGYGGGSGADRYGYPPASSAGYRGMYDADGEPVDADADGDAEDIFVDDADGEDYGNNGQPGSPEKTGEMVLLPER